MVFLPPVYCFMHQVLPLQVVSVQLVDSRAVKSVRDSLGHKVTELGVKVPPASAIFSRLALHEARRTGLFNRWA